MSTFPGSQFSKCHEGTGDIGELSLSLLNSNHIWIYSQPVPSELEALHRLGRPVELPFVDLSDLVLNEVECADMFLAR